jgi:hypothetical protein
MKKAYRNILIISVLLSAISLILLGNDFVSTNLSGSVLAYTLWGTAFTVLFSFVIGMSYFVVEKKGNAYLGILTFSVLLMLFLFTMDYTVWDVATPAPPASRVIFELLVYGSMYVGIFFAVFSGFYLMCTQSIRLISRLAGR